MPGVGIGPSKQISTPAADSPASSADSNMYPEIRVSLPISTGPSPSLANTLPAAQPNFMMKSGVMGASPTLPRIPSVPKYFRVFLLMDIPQTVEKNYKLFTEIMQALPVAHHWVHRLFLHHQPSLQLVHHYHDYYRPNLQDLLAVYLP